MTNVENIWQYRDSQNISFGFIQEVVLAGKTVGTTHSDSGLGSIVETYLTLPDHVDDFYAEFGGNVPSDALANVLTNAIGHLISVNRLTPNITLHKEVILRQTEYDGFDLKKTKPVLWKQILEKAKDWWEFVVDNLGQGKEVVTVKDLAISKRVADYTLAHPTSKHFFIPLEGRDFYYQQAIFFEHNSVPCKALVDVIIVSHAKRKVVVSVIKPVFDIGNDSIAFLIKKNQYALQLSFYEVAVQSFLKDIGAGGYEIETNWLFLSKDIRENGAYFDARIWPCTNNMKEWARYGGTITGTRSYELEALSITGSQEVMGWEEGLHIYKDAHKKGFQIYKRPDKIITKSLAENLFFT